MSGHNIITQLAGGMQPTTVTAAGTSATDAAAIGVGMTVTAGTGAEGVILPTCEPGSICIIKNTGTGNLIVYPHSGGYINAAASSFTMATLTACIFIRTGTTQWYTVPYAAS
jgi:hypothetical protein